MINRQKDDFSTDNTGKMSLLLVGSMLSLSMILLVRDVGGVSINKMIIAALCAFWAFFLNGQELVSFLVFCIPLFCGIPGKYILAIVIPLLIYKNGLSKQTVGYSLIFVALELFAARKYQSVDTLETAGYFLFLFVLFYLLYTEAELDYGQIMYCFIAGGMVLCGIIMMTAIKKAPGNWLELFARGAFRIGDSHMEEGGEPIALRLNSNSLAYFSIIDVTCCIIMLIHDQTHKNRGIVWLSLILCSFAGLMTVSRSWLLFLAVALALFSVEYIKSVKGFFTIAAVCCVLLLAGIVIVQIRPELLEAFTTRMTDSDMSSGAGRTRIFEEYWNAFWTNPEFILCGSGVMNYVEVVNVDHMSMHNALEQILVCYGVPGCIAFLTGLIKPILDPIRDEKIPLNFKITFWVIVLFVQTIQFVNPYILMLPYVMGYISLKYGMAVNKSDERVISDESITGCVVS